MKRNVTYFKILTGLFAFCLLSTGTNVFAQNSLGTELLIENNSAVFVPTASSQTANHRPEAFPDPYCEMTFIDGVEPISRVIFAGIDNATSPTVSGSPAMEDFTALIGDVDTGTRYDLRVEGNTNGDFIHSVTAFIDWNQNGTFEANEAYPIGLLSDSDGEDGIQAWGTVLVPENALEGETRMRIVKRWADGQHIACGEGNVGQTEDYTINVHSSSSVCDETYSGSFQNGIGNVQTLLFADDFEVAADTQMSVNQVTLRIFADISTADLYFYENNNGIPGATVDSFPNLAPTSQEFVSEEFGFNTYELVFDLPTSTTLSGGENGTLYWVGVQTYEGTEGSTNYWETADSNTNALAHFSTNGGDTWAPNSSGEDLAFIISGTCGDDNSYAGCIQDFQGAGSVGLGITKDEDRHYMIANDFIVEPDTQFALEKIMVWVTSEGEPTFFELALFEELDEGIGSQIGNTIEDASVSYYPDGVVGFSTRWAVELTLPEPIVFENDTEENVHYWIALSGGLSNTGEFTFWTSYTYNAGDPTYPAWRSLDGGDSWEVYENARTGARADGMMTVFGICDAILNTPNVSINNFTFYPNPVTDILHIVADHAMTSVSVFNLQGQQVLNSKTSAQHIDLSALPAGIYLSKVTFEDGSVETFKIIKR